MEIQTGVNLWLEPFQALWSDISQIAPRLAAALAALLLGLALAWPARAAAARLLAALQLERRLEGLWVQRYWARGVGSTPAKVLANFAFYAVLALAMLLAVRLLGIGPGRAVLDALLGLLPRILTFMLVLFLGSLLANFLAVLAQLALASVGAQHPHLFGQVVAWATMGVAVLFSLEQLGLAGRFFTQLVLLVVAAAALALALAFGLGCRDLAREFLVELLKKDADKEGGNP